MNKKDAGKFAECMIVLNDTLGSNNQPPSAAKIEFYFKALSDLTIDEVESGALHVANTKTIKVFPTPAEIREAVKGKPEDQAVIAADKIQNALRGVGGYASVCFDDPIIHLIIQNYGGWDKLSDITQDEWKWLRKEFEKHYKVYAVRAVSLTVIPERLAGIHEMINAAKQLPWPDENTVYIGDQQKALAWTGQRKALAGEKPIKMKKLTEWVGHAFDPDRKTT